MGKWSEKENKYMFQLMLIRGTSFRANLKFNNILKDKPL